MSRLLNWVPRLWAHWISLLGVILTTISGLTLLVSIFASPDNVYAGAIVYMVLPGVFLLGLVLIPIGLWRANARRKKGGAASEEADSVAASFRELLAKPVVRRRVIFVAVATVINIMIIAAIGQSALSYMDSPKFCGTACHQVMQPEYDAYRRSPHARVPCVECHIGPGASFFVKSKIDGLRQVWGVLTDDFHRPIQSPIHDLRPARDTCEECHWPARFTGNRLKFVTHHEDDKASTPQITSVLLHVGGQDHLRNKHVGIHWHVDPRVKVVYEALDDHRDHVGTITVLQDGVPVKVYKAPGDKKPVHELRTMDCVDCHNRPTHIYDETPQRAVDASLVAGELDRRLPWIRKFAVSLLQRTDRPRDGVEAEFTKELAAMYDKEAPDDKPSDDAIAKAGAAIGAIYKRNIFPKMHVVWNTYRSNLGHREVNGEELGCFRCHDDEHEDQNGDTLSQDCDLCHNLLSEEDVYGDLPEELQSAYGATIQVAADDNATKDDGDDDAKADEAAPAKDGGDDAKADESAPAKDGGDDDTAKAPGDDGDAEAKEAARAKDGDDDAKAKEAAPAKAKEAAPAQAKEAAPAKDEGAK